MSYVCLSSPAWTAGESVVDLTAALLVHAPRVVVERASSTPLLWADARGLHAATLAEQLLDVLREKQVSDARAGTALTPIAAQVAATWALEMREAVMQSMAAGDIVVRQTPSITSVRPGRDRAFLADFPVAVLSPSDAMANLLDGIGVETCGQLAALDAEAVEVRLGADGVDLWDRARARDGRWLFRTPMRALPSASLDWTDYVLRSTERLLFVANALLSSICAALMEQGERAREMSLVFSLANRTQHVLPLRSARPSADQKRWLRLVREALEGPDHGLADAVTGLGIRVESVTGNDGAQGDLFDRGFATAGAVETALAQLADDHGELIVSPSTTQHPLVDRRTTWVGKRDVDAPVVRGGESGVGQQGVNLSGVSSSGLLTLIPTPGSALALVEESSAEVAPALTLQLLPVPQPIAVATAPRRDHAVPVRYRDRLGWHTVVDAAGPDRVSGGQWDEGYAREYFRCVREDGMLVWLFRDRSEWFLQGWWD